MGRVDNIKERPLMDSRGMGERQREIGVRRRRNETVHVANGGWFRLERLVVFKVT